MTLKNVSGSVRMNPTASRSFLISSSIVKFSVTPIRSTSTTENPIANLGFTVIGKVTTLPDEPGIAARPAPVLTKPNQLLALESAAANTSVLIPPLNPITAADEAADFYAVALAEVYATIETEINNALPDTVIIPD